MATLSAAAGGRSSAQAGNLSTAQTGNGASTNIIDVGRADNHALLKIVTTVGATPTVTIAIEGSADGTNFFNIPYSTQAAPTTVAVANVVITTATTNYYYLQAGYPWRYLRLTYSANTNVTSTADVYAF